MVEQTGSVSFSALLTTGAPLSLVGRTRSANGLESSVTGALSSRVDIPFAASSVGKMSVATISKHIGFGIDGFSYKLSWAAPCFGKYDSRR